MSTQDVHVRTVYAPPVIILCVFTNSNQIYSLIHRRVPSAAKNNNKRCCSAR